MTQIGRYVVGAIVFALLGALCLAASSLDRRIAAAQQDFAAGNYQRADEALESVEESLAYAGWIPGLGSGPLNDVRTRRAAIRYWTGQYDRIVSGERGGDPAGSAASVDVQLIAANGVYRRGQATAKGRQATLDALQASGNAYLEVLRNAPRRAPGSSSMGPAHWDAATVAAYNYEYVVRTRDDVDKGRRAPELTDTAEDGPAGKKGGLPPQDPKKPDMKLLIPLEPSEMDKGIDPGRGSQIERKG